MPDPAARACLGIPRAAWIVLTAALSVLAAVAALVPPRGTPGLEVADLGEGLALALHGLGYALLAFCACLAQSRPRTAATALVLVCYGVVLEALQGLLGQRSFQGADLLANSAGVLIGVVTAAALIRRDARSAG